MNLASQDAHNPCALVIITPLFSFLISSLFRSALLTLTLALAALSTTSYATLIYAEDFDRPNTSTLSNGWEEHESDSNDVAIYNDRLRLRDYTSTELTHASITIDTSGYRAIEVALNWQVLSSTEASDSFGLKVGGNEIWQTELGDSGLFELSIALGAYAENKPLLELMFWLDVNSRTESIYLDRFEITGEQIAFNKTNIATQVPEPGGLGLAFVGFTAIFFRRGLYRFLGRVPHRFFDRFALRKKSRFVKTKNAPVQRFAIAD
jgi:hypothetical protein